MATRRNITAYLCPEPWKPTGICSYGRCQESTSSERVLDNQGKLKQINLQSYLIGEGYDIGNRFDTYLLPSDKDVVDCLFCIPACDEIRQGEGDIENFSHQILDSFNNLRKTHPEECPQPCFELVLDLNACSAAQWFCNDMVIKNYCCPKNGIDSLGRTPKVRLQNYGCRVINNYEIVDYIEYSEQDVSIEQVANDFVTNWSNTPSIRKQIMYSHYNAIGVGLQKETHVINYKPIFKYIAVIDLVYLHPDNRQLYDVPLPTLECATECLQKIHWYQKSYTVENVERPLPYIVCEVPIPRNCAIEKMEFRFEESPCYAVFKPDLTKIPDERKTIPSNNSLRFVWEKEKADPLIDMGIMNEGKTWFIVWSLRNSACFIPGEYMIVYVWLKGFESQCNPFIWAINWFETPCWTSGIVQGCGLLDEEGNVIEGGLGHSFSDAWIGDERLRWLISYKGQKELYWLKCSDFAEYKIGDRVFIQKQGLSKALNYDGTEAEQDPACRWPYPHKSELPMNQQDGSPPILSDSNVTYTLDPSNDIIVPQKFYA